MAANYAVFDIAAVVGAGRAAGMVDAESNVAQVLGAGSCRVPELSFAAWQC